MSDVVEVPLQPLIERLSRRATRGLVTAAQVPLLRARLCDWLRDRDLDPLKDKEWERATKRMGPSDWKTFDLLLDGLRAEKVGEAFGRLVAHRGGEVGLDALVSGSHDLKLVAIEAVATQRRRAEEVGRILVRRLHARVAGEEPDVSDLRFGELDTQSTMAYLDQTLDEIAAGLTPDGEPGDPVVRPLPGYDPSSGN